MRGPAFFLALALLAGCRPQTAPAPAPTAPLQFRNVAAEVGLDWTCGIVDQTPLNITRMVTGGAGWLDYDADGWPDAVLAGLKGVRLYRNLQGQRFQDVTPGSGLDRITGEPQGVACADWDGDGRTDLLVTRLDGAVLLRNRGGGKFEDVTRAAGLELSGWCTSAAFADADGDGWLDLYVGRYVHFAPGMPEYFQDGEAQLALGPDAYEPQRGVFFRNARGRFREATQAAGLGGAHGKTLGVAWADYDADGDQDLYLANDQALGDFFVNDGRGRFRNVGVENGTAVGPNGNRQAGMGVDWADYDADGRPDLIVTTFYDELKSLYRQMDGGLFQEQGQAAGLTRDLLRGTAFGVTFGDWDNDGDPDLMLANGHVQDQVDRVDPDTGYRQRTQVLLNEAGLFREVSAQAGAVFQEKIVGRALAAADFDRDGRLDALVANFTGPPQLLRNESAAGNWLRLALQQPGPNRQALGARVTVRSGDRQQVQMLQTGRSYLSSFPAELHFGLGSAAAADVEVTWPDGSRQRFPGLQANTEHRLTRSGR